jgi:hypothetical protein
MDNEQHGQQPQPHILSGLPYPKEVGPSVKFMLEPMFTLAKK